MLKAIGPTAETQFVVSLHWVLHRLSHIWSRPAAIWHMAADRGSQQKRGVCPLQLGGQLQVIATMGGASGGGAGAGCAGGAPGPAAAAAGGGCGGPGCAADDGSGRVHCLRRGGVGAVGLRPGCRHT